MTYHCPLIPPHVNEDGSVMLHKSRKECTQMGLAHRASVPHPETKKEVPVAGAPQAATEPTVPVGPPMAPPKKKGKFQIFKRSAGAPPEAETQKDAEEAHPSWQLSEDLTVMFWTTVLSLARGGIEFIDKAIQARHPYDTKQLEFTASEEQMVGEVMPGITTRLLKWFGIKSIEAATAFIHGMVIIRVFGRIFLSIGIHFYSELKIRGQEKKEAREAGKLTEAQKQAAIPAEYNVAQTTTTTNQPSTTLTTTYQEVENAPNTERGLGGSGGPIS